MIKNILFDLDGTLINTLKEFDKKFFVLLESCFSKAKYDSKKLSEGVLLGLQAMRKNDGRCSNEDAFWKCFAEKTEIQKEDILEIFDCFYDVQYNELCDCVNKIGNVNSSISALKNKGYNLILSTNPLFPLKAIEKRAAFGGIDYSNFSYITSFENSSYAKPNINYYREILENNNLKIEETMMFGNDLIEDLAIEKIGIPCFIITNYMVNEDNIENCTKKGDYDAFLSFLNNLPKIN